MITAFLNLSTQIYNTMLEPYIFLQLMKGNMMRIAVIGDEGVGKTSLICAIISDLATDVPKTHKKVVLPPDMCAYSKDIFTEIIDTSTTVDLAAQIKASDLLLLVYDVSNAQSVIRLKQHWLPIINYASKDTPVVIVGNKYDKIELPIDQEREYTPVRDVLRGLVRAYKQVQMGIQCSAYYDKNVKNVLKSAQRAVLYPIGPLYDISSKQVTPSFRKALLRIFRILDSQLSGSLSDNDLIRLQQKVFQSELSTEDIRAIKNIVQRQCEQQQLNSISVQGFIAFQRKCIEMLKIQICWSILHYFDYDNNLQIRNLADTFVIGYSEGQSLELSQNVVSFLHKIYIFAQKITPPGQNAMQKLFEPSPSVPLPQFLQQGLSLERFILIWHLFTLLDYRQCYRALLYIGYDSKLDECFTITRGKKSYSDLLKLKERNIYSILFVDDKEHSSHINSLFTGGVEEGIITRNVMMHSSKVNSKVIILLKVREHHFRQFIVQNELAKRIDLIISFTSERSALRQKHIQFCPHVMQKEITRDIAENTIKLFELPELNLHQFPITVKKGHTERLTEYILNIFQHVEQGYSFEYIEKLKNQSNQKTKVLIGIASSLVLAGIGFLVASKRFLK